jgi:hypothetical protein
MIDAATSAMRELLASTHADKTIDEVIRPFRRTADRDHYLNGLRKTGMPER